MISTYLHYRNLSILIISIFLLHDSVFSQEKYGKSANLGVGVVGYSGYYRYVGTSLPVVNFNYEFDVAPNFTLAPFVSFYRWSNAYYWGNNNNPSRYYTYRETVIPVGLKGSYYFDSVFKAGSKWDFYLAGSVGVALARTSWDVGYLGDKHYYHKPNTVFFDIHMGAEYHLSSQLGIYLDFSSGVSTVGLGFHGN